MLKIKTNQILVNLKGENLIGEDKGDVLLGVVLGNVMGAKTSNPSLGWQLGKKFSTQEEVDLKAEEIVFIKAEITAVSGHGGWMSSILAGQILEILDGKFVVEDCLTVAKE